MALAAHGAPAAAADSDFLGLLRARDLTPFGFLRLDMRPAHAVVSPKGTWAIEAELAHQNTWALSKAVEQYLESRPGRTRLGDAELAGIRALPGENYLVDMELAELDVTFHYKFSSHWGGYLVLSGVNYSGGFLDHSIEQFHDFFGFDDNGRPQAERNDVNIIADLKSVDLGLLESPTTGGMLDPTIGFRYSLAEQVKGWNVVLEAAAKLAYRGSEEFITTGKTDFGLQATFQRFSEHHAWYVSASTVYYDGSSNVMPTPPQWVPTLVVGYERKLNPQTHLILQGYVSDSIFTRDETDVSDLLETKYQLSLGIYRRVGRGVISFALTENLAEHQQHAGHRHPGRLGLQPGTRARRLTPRRSEPPGQLGEDLVSVRVVDALGEQVIHGGVLFQERISAVGIHEEQLRQRLELVAEPRLEPEVAQAEVWQPDGSRNEVACRVDVPGGEDARLRRKLRDRASEGRGDAEIVDDLRAGPFGLVE